MTILIILAAILVMISVQQSEEIIIIGCYEMNTRKSYIDSLIIDQIK